jgi:predicted nucleic acid-binding protein
VPFQDALIATVAIHYGLPVWAEDVHYPAMQRILQDLKLFDPASIGTK